jgi:sodium-independent sulfate anion transporter 11
LILLLVRIAHPRGGFLGKVTLEADSGGQRKSREIFIPIGQNGINNPNVKAAPSASGVVIFKLEDSIIYPNCSLVNGVLTDYVKENTRRGMDLSTVSLRDRAWNDHGPRKNFGLEQAMNEKKPSLHAVVLDFSSV